MSPENLQAINDSLAAGGEQGFFTVSNILSIQNILYVIAALFFIFGIKGLTHPRTAVQGNLKALAGMLMAMAITLLAFKGDLSVWPGWYLWAVGIVIGGGFGYYAAKKVAMTEMPEMVALFNGSGGLASMLVAGAVFMNYYFKAHGSPGADAEGRVRAKTLQSRRPPLHALRRRAPAGRALVEELDGPVLRLAHPGQGPGRLDGQGHGGDRCDRRPSRARGYGERRDQHANRRRSKEPA